MPVLPDLAYPITLTDGTRLHTRRGTPADLPQVQDLHSRASLASRWHRYGCGLAVLSCAQWEHLTRPDRAVTWLTATDEDPNQLVATTCVVADPLDPAAYDLGLLIADAWQGRGLGAHLTRWAVHDALTRGGTALTALVDCGNTRMLRILNRLSPHPLPRTHSHQVQVRLDLTDLAYGIPA